MGLRVHLNTKQIPQGTRFSYRCPKHFNITLSSVKLCAAVMVLGLLPRSILIYFYFVCFFSIVSL